MNDETYSAGTCAAHGCPMPGTHSTSTSGTNGWLCAFHFGRDATAWQPLTVELNRVKFLVDAVQAIRRYRLRDCWESVYRNIQHEIRLNQRSDLLRRQSEGALQWANRLDGVLREICAGKAPMPIMQPPAADPGASDSWKKVEYQVPEHV